MYIEFLTNMPEAFLGFWGFLVGRVEGFRVLDFSVWGLRVVRVQGLLGIRDVFLGF